MKNVNVSYVVTNEYELSSQKWTLNNVKIKHIYIKAWTGVEAMTIFDTGAVLYQLSKQAN